MLSWYVALWPVLCIIAIINGIARVKLYEKRLGELRAHQLSSVTGSLLISGAVCLFHQVLPIASLATAIEIGVLWCAMTIAFEFGFGHYVMKHPWERLLYDYNLCAGRIWILVLIATGSAPVLAWFIA